MTERRRLGGVVVDADVRIPRRDGTALVADVYRPAGPGRSPALLLRLPYDKRRAQSYWYKPPSWYAERHFAVVVEDVRGRHRSPGAFVPLEHEAADGADLAAWAAERPWCDGTVGMYGYSYCGLVQLLAAGEGGGGPLRAIVPALAVPGLGDGCLHSGGVPAAAFTVTWALELEALRLDAALGGWPLTAATLRRLVLEAPLGSLLPAARDEVAASWLRHWLAHDPADPYWRRPSHRPAYERVRADALHVGGWYDTFRAGTVGHYRRLRSARGAAGTDRLLVGPWTHQPLRAGDHGLLDGPDPAAWSIDAAQLPFLDAVLRDGEPPPGPAVRVAVQNSAEAWEGDAWPPEAARPVRWHLRSGGRANGRDGDGALTLEAPAPSPPDHLVYSHADPVPAVGGDDCGDPELVGMGPADQQAVERRADVLVYTAPPARRETLIAGEAAATLYVEAHDPVSQWLARVCLVTSAGRSVNLAEGVTRLDHGARAGPVRAEVPIGPVAVRLRPGERLRLHVTQGSSPRWGGLRDAGGRPAVTRSLVLHDPDHPSALVLPEVS